MTFAENVADDIINALDDRFPSADDFDFQEPKVIGLSRAEFEIRRDGKTFRISVEEEL